MGVFEYGFFVSYHLGLHGIWRDKMGDEERNGVEED